MSDGWIVWMSMISWVWLWYIRASHKNTSSVLTSRKRFATLSLTKLQGKAVSLTLPGLETVFCCLFYLSSTIVDTAIRLLSMITKVVCSFGETFFRWIGVSMKRWKGRIIEWWNVQLFKRWKGHSVKRSDGGKINRCFGGMMERWNVSSTWYTRH